MIYGFIVITTSGLLVKYKFVEELKEIEDNEVSLIASGLSALYSFFSQVTNNPLENVMGGNFKIVVSHKEDIILAMISDRTDMMVEGLVRKYLNILVDAIKKKNIDLEILFESDIERDLGEIFMALEEEIRKLNEEAKKVKYLH